MVDDIVHTFLQILDPVTYFLYLLEFIGIFCFVKNYQRMCDYINRNPDPFTHIALTNHDFFVKHFDFLLFFTSLIKWILQAFISNFLGLN